MVNVIPGRRAANTIALIAISLSAQNREAPWSGVLRNDAGAPVAEATIRLAPGAAHLSATTDREGRFSFPAVAPGDYSISVEWRGATATYSARTQLPDIARRSWCSAPTAYSRSGWTRSMRPPVASGSPERRFPVFR